MARKPTMKELVNTRLASTYGGWIYCGHCGENIGYLCYVTYDNLKLTYKCNCGGDGSIHIAFDDKKEPFFSEKKLVTLKNRLCCPNDESPLFTLLEKKLSSYHYEVDCVRCGTSYREEKA